MYHHQWVSTPENRAQMTHWVALIVIALMMDGRAGASLSSDVINSDWFCWRSWKPNKTNWQQQILTLWEIFKLSLFYCCGRGAGSTNGAIIASQAPGVTWWPQFPTGVSTVSLSGITQTTSIIIIIDMAREYAGSPRLTDCCWDGPFLSQNLHNIGETI